MKEYLSEDILDINLAKCFVPIHLLQQFLGSTHADIKYCFVTPTTTCQRMYTIVWVLLVGCSIFHLIQFYTANYSHVNLPLCVSLTCGAFIQYLVYLFNIYYVRFTGGERSIDIYLKLQKIDRGLNLNSVSFYSRKHCIYNCIIVVSVVISHLTGFCVFVFFCVENAGLTIPGGLGLMVIYLEAVLTGSLIYYLGMRLKFFNELIQYNIILKKENNIVGVNFPWVLKDDYKIQTGCSRTNQQTNGSLTLVNTILALKTTLQTFNKVSQRFQFSILSIVFTVFFWTLLIIEAMVVGWKSGLFPLVGVITLTGWLVFHFLLLVGLAVLTDWFIKQVNNTKGMAVYALSIYYEGPVFMAAKNILKTLEVDVPIFSVYGIFTLKRTLPLVLLALITDNILILLQFTL